MTFDMLLLEDVPTGWSVPDGPIPVKADGVKIGEATVELRDDGLYAKITLDQEEDEFRDAGVRLGVVVGGDDLKVKGVTT